MIEKLYIENIGGIRGAELAFTRGLNVITGESGAGKSSVVRSLELLSGTRGGVKFIRAGEESGRVEARFTKHSVMREVLSSGRSRARVDGAAAGLNECAQIVNGLVRIQSQFAQMELLNPERQLAMLDACLPEDVRTEKFPQFHKVFDAARKSSGDLRAMKKRRAEIERRYANAREIFSLVKTAQPESGLELRLENQLADITHRIASRERARNSLDALTGGMSEHGLLEKVRACFENLEGFLTDGDNITSAMDVLNDAVKHLAGELGDDESDSVLLEETENRLGALRRLKRLCNISDENELMNFCGEIYTNLDWLENSYTELEELSARSLEERKKANALAMEIRNERQEAAKSLTQRVNAVLVELAMTGIEFGIGIAGLQKLSRNGADSVEFTLSDGVRSGRVEKIASGGELSRLLLALQLSLPDEWLPPTIVFDEVEAGLGGKAAVLSGLQLKELSRKCQVILVTHEASIAALGDTHILIQRTNGETFTKSITGEDRVKEIARMLSGSPDMSEAQKHAQILLASAHVKTSALTHKL